MNVSKLVTVLAIVRNVRTGAGKRGEEKHRKRKTSKEKNKETRPRGQRCVLGLKKDIDKERDPYFDGQTDRRIYPVIEMRECTAIISNEFRHIVCAVNVSFLHFS